LAVGFQHIAGPSLADLRARLAGIKGAAFRAKLAQNLAEEARTQVANGFRQERDPYGEAWAPLKSREGKILRDTGRMAASVATAQVGPDGFRIEVGANYAKYHQLGTKPHQRAERAARQSARGRFVGPRARESYLLRIRAHTTPGLPRRQMLPSRDRGGLGPIWASAFGKVSRKMLDQQLAGA
jgi:phage virion morphogenesis protein